MACSVKVLPEGLVLSCEAGVSLLEAISSHDLPIEVPCGGKGFCGKCRGQVVAGRENIRVHGLGRLSVADALAGWVLMCQTEVVGDITVIVPESARLAGQKILTGGKVRAVALAPMFGKLAVTVAEATIDDPRSDWDRLLAAVRTADVASVCPEVDVRLARRLPELLRGADAASQGRLTVVTQSGRIADLEAGDTSAEAYGVAFDIGTTTVVGYLIDQNTGRELAVSSLVNPQVIFGDDVLSRINLTMEDPQGLAKLSEKVRGAIDDILADLIQTAGISASRIYDLVVVGNTTMGQLLLGIPPKHLGLYPYVATVSGAVTVPPSDLGIVGCAPSALLRVLPNVASFVGADTVGVMLAVEVDQVAAPTLVVDIGTNGEIVMANGGRVWTASCAAGPAFEGGHLSCGMRASAGAIDRVKLGEECEFRTIGDAPAKGICGSGLIDALADMLRFGIVDMAGRMVGPADLPDTTPASVRDRVIKDASGARFVLAWASESATGQEVAITQRDVRELQLIKAAIFAGCTILLDAAGIKPAELDCILLAGAFGNYIDRENALFIGLIPDVPLAKVSAIGNAAGSGARIALRSTNEFARASRLAHSAIFVELASRPDFQDQYVEGMFFANAQ